MITSAKSYTKQTNKQKQTDRTLGQKERYTDNITQKSIHIHTHKKRKRKNIYIKKGRKQPNQ